MHDVQESAPGRVFEHGRGLWALRVGVGRSKLTVFYKDGYSSRCWSNAHYLYLEAKRGKRNSDLGYIFGSKIPSDLKASRQNFTRAERPRRGSPLKPGLDEKAYCFRRLIILSERLASLP